MNDYHDDYVCTRRNSGVNTYVRLLFVSTYVDRKKLISVRTVKKKKKRKKRNTSPNNDPHKMSRVSIVVYNRSNERGTVTCHQIIISIPLYLSLLLSILLKRRNARNYHHRYFCVKYEINSSESLKQKKERKKGSQNHNRYRMIQHIFVEL